MLHKQFPNKKLPSIYLTITGGGTGIISRLLEEGGASSYFVGAEVPYGQDQTDRIFESFDAYCINDNLKIVSAEAARWLACHSRIQANLGIGVTASLMKTEGEREGRINEAYACFNLNGKLTECHWIFEKTREREWYDSRYTDKNNKTPVTRKRQEQQLVANIWEQLVKVIHEN